MADLRPVVLPVSKLSPYNLRNLDVRFVDDHPPARRQDVGLVLDSGSWGVLVATNRSSFVECPASVLTCDLRNDFTFLRVLRRMVERAAEEDQSSWSNLEPYCGLWWRRLPPEPGPHARVWALIARGVVIRTWSDKDHKANLIPKLLDLRETEDVDLQALRIVCENFLWK